MATLGGHSETGSSWAATWTQPYTSGVFLLISLSWAELAVASFPTSSGCSGAEGVGGGIGLDGGEGSGVSEGVTGTDPDSEVDWDGVSDWSNLNTSKSAMSKSWPVPKMKVGEAMMGM